MRVLTLGEIMLRLSTPKGTRLTSAEGFSAHYGGAEANVAASLANFQCDVQYASILPENALGLAIEGQLKRFGVTTNFLHFDANSDARLGSYYLENGAGVRSAKVLYDRASSSFASADYLPWDIEALFAEVSVFHLSGITPALSRFWRKTSVVLAKIAFERGIKVSLDINYRSKLWETHECASFLEEVMPYVSILSAGNRDAQVFFGLKRIDQLRDIYPNLEIIYYTERKVLSSEHNRLKGQLLMEGYRYSSVEYDIPNIVDRIGGGDAFAAGILFGVIRELDPQSMVDFATSASVLKHTVSGDMNQVTTDEVWDFALTGCEVVR